MFASGKTKIARVQIFFAVVQRRQTQYPGNLWRLISLFGARASLPANPADKDVRAPETARSKMDAC
jgi:hypothetical protein